MELGIGNAKLIFDFKKKIGTVDDDDVPNTNSMRIKKIHTRFSLYVCHNITHRYILNYFAFIIKKDFLLATQILK